MTPPAAVATPMPAELAPAARPTPHAALQANDDSVGLSKDEIRTTIRTRLADIQYCYQKRLLRRPELAGIVTVAFRIGPDGAVESANAIGLDDEPLTTCIAEVIRALRFPSPRGVSFVNVTYPFTLRSDL